MSWYESNKKWILPIVCILVLAGVFTAGRYSNPSKIVERLHTVEVEKIVYQEKIVEKKVYVKATATDVHKEVTTIKRPDGTVETRVVIDDKTKINEASTQESEKNIASTTDKSTTVDKEKIVEYSKPQWRLSLRTEVGALIKPTVQPMLGIGVSIERRIIGPLFIGLSVSTDLGFNATGLTGPYGVKGGLSIGMEF